MGMYVSVFDYLRSTNGQETGSLIGNSGYTTNSVAAGATTLTLAALTVQLNANDQVCLFDGANTEFAIVTTQAIVGATSVSVQPLKYAHAANIPYCSDGVHGSLAQTINIASAELEDICQQSLFMQSYTETYQLRSMDAVITNDNLLSIRPKHFPINSISSLSIMAPGGSTIPMDTTQCTIDARARLISAANAKPYGISTTLTYSYGPQTPGYINMTYSAGFAYTSLPPQVKQAAILLTSDALSDRNNPTGSAESQMGQRHVVAFLRGDLSGQSALYKRADKLLQTYKRER